MSDLEVFYGGILKMSCCNVALLCSAQGEWRAQQLKFHRYEFLLASVGLLSMQNNVGVAI